MSGQTRVLAFTVLTLALVVPTDLVAQEEDKCVLVSRPATEPSVEKITQAAELEDPVEARSLYEEALEELKSEIANDDDPTALWLAAEAHIGLGNFEAADELLDRFVSVDPTCEERAGNSRFNGWADTYNEAIQAYQAGDQEAALAAFLKANVIYEDSRAFNNAGLLYKELGDMEAAIEQFRLAVAADNPTDQARDASLNLAEALRSVDQGGETMAAPAEDPERPLPDPEAQRFGMFMFIPNKDELTDEDRSAVLTVEEEYSSDAIRYTSLYWQCDKSAIGGVRIVITTDEFLASDAVRVMYRFDKEPAVERMLPWEVSTDGTGAFVPPTHLARFWEGFQTASRLLVRIFDHQGTPHTWGFPLDGFSAAVEQLPCLPEVLEFLKPPTPPPLPELPPG